MNEKGSFSIEQLEHALKQRPMLQYEGAIELRTDFDGEAYLSLPVGYRRAVEVEYGQQEGAEFFAVFQRAWDRTGGLSDDSEVFTVNIEYVLVAAQLIDFFVHELVSEDERLNDQWQDTP